MFDVFDTIPLIPFHSSHYYKPDLPILKCHQPPVLYTVCACVCTCACMHVCIIPNGKVYLKIPVVPSALPTLGSQLSRLLAAAVLMVLEVIHRNDGSTPDLEER